MNKISAWLYRFMQGRYGFDQLGQALGVVVAVAWIFSVIAGVLANMFRLIWVAWLSTILNWAGVIALLLMVFRIMSRNHAKRRSENEAFLRRRQGRARTSSKDMSTNAGDSAQQGYKYLSCSFCGQQMRVPSGKGKIAVKCPACGEKTIVQS